MDSMPASSALAQDRGLGVWPVQTKDYKNCMCCFSAKHATLKIKNND